MPFLKLLSLAFILYSVTASLPKMSLSKGEKLTKNMQSFPRHLVRFLLFYGGEWIPVCLVCSQQVSVVKEHLVFRKGAP